MKTLCGRVNHTRRNRGFTLVEMMIGLVIVGIGLTIAVPSFQGMTARNQIAVQVNEFLVSVNLARSEASRRGRNVCIQSVGPVAGQFGDGWRVVEVSSGNCNGEVIRSFGALSGESTLDIVGSATTLQFTSLGALDSNTPESVDLCYPEQQGRRIYINMLGRSKSHRPDDADLTRRPVCP
ncbi:MAG: type IV fimbrial biogenesis protein FimT [Granulosicoccus sp.]|jgi:type IV fimbrial biogenesis protein FimT